MEKAYDYNSQALTIANAYNLSAEKVKALNNIGLDFWCQGNHASALTSYLEALMTAKGAKDAERMLVINNNIALLYDDNNDSETALTFYEVAKKLSIETNNDKRLASVLLNMAGINKEMKNITAAEQMVDSSIHIFTKLKNKDWLSNGYTVKADIEFIQNNFKRALKLYKESEKLCDELDFLMGYVGTYKGIAESNLKLKNLDVAEKYGLKAL